MILFFILLYNCSTNIHIHDYFPSLIKSVEGTTIHVVVIGNTDLKDSIIPTAIVQNVKFEQCSWIELTNKLEYFLAKKLTTLLTLREYSKAGDFKPMLPALFPELVKGYEWCGWLDNDLWISKKLEDTILLVDEDYIQITGSKRGFRASYSPISVIRTKAYEKVILPILKDEKVMLHSVFRVSKYRDFSGWGVVAFGGMGHDNSFSHILETAYKQIDSFSVISLSTIFHKTAAPYVLDHNCRLNQKLRYTNMNNRNKHTAIASSLCGVCTMTFSKNGNRTILRDAKGTEVLFCHFQMSKLRYSEGGGSLNVSLEDIWTAPTLRSSYSKGIQILS